MLRPRFVQQGPYHAYDEYGRVVWRFAPSAAGVAQEFEFHPIQQLMKSRIAACASN